MDKFARRSGKWTRLRKFRDARRSQYHVRLAIFLIITATLLAFLLRSASADVSYSYDALGRLRAVVAPSGSAAQYTYDADGNITKIDTPTIALYNLSPSSGTVGTSVTIYGVGFSPTSSQNSVIIQGIPNWVTATITSSTQTTIVFTVPTGATSGHLLVSSPAGSVQGLYLDVF